MQSFDLFQHLSKFKIKGLGPKALEHLKNIPIETLFDLLYDFPNNYEDRSHITDIVNIREGDFVTIRGKIASAQLLSIRGRGKLFKAYISDSTGTLELIWFSSAYLKGVLKKGTEVNITGKVVGPKYKIVNPEYSFVLAGGIFPIYSLTKGINQSLRRKISKEAVKLGLNIEEVLPLNLVKKYDILNRGRAIKEIHFPKSSYLLEQAKRRFSIEELFIFQLATLQRKYEIARSVIKYNVSDDKTLVKEYIKSLPFSLTSAQKRTITEIYKDIAEGKIVNRLIQGDVGSGKSVVAFIVLLYMISNNYQCAFMAPTETLAEQHYVSIKDSFSNMDLRIAFLSGKTKTKERREILENLESGSIDLVIGTHALIYERVKFKNLGLTIIDEQHKFGVRQRRALREKGGIPNIILMSATPIPRSLALTIHGDLNISVIDELPPGRREIKTEVVRKDNLSVLFENIKRSLDENTQCYIVCPLISDSDKIDAFSAENVYEDVKEKYFKGYRSDILHGKLKSEEKEKVISDFSLGKTQILVSTTVIEVGINVPNASIMVILNADRFGLAQLHQIRGRVGRGSQQSYCYLVNGNPYPCKRLNILVDCSDGFKIAEEDLKFREAGDLLGTKQSGISHFKFLNLLRDVKSIKLVREEAEEYLKNSKGILDNRLKLEFEKRFTEKSVMN